MEKITDEAIRKSVVSTLIETFDTMVGIPMETVEDAAPAILEQGSRMVGAVYFAGEVFGVISFHLSEAFSRKITASMLGIEESQIENISVVRDVIGELSNIVAGNLKTEFVDAGLTCVISTPSITLGSSFKIDPVNIAPVMRFTFHHQDDHYIAVELCAKEEIGAKEDILSDLPSNTIMERVAVVDVRGTVVSSVIDVFETMLDMKVTAIDTLPDDYTESFRTVGSVSFAGAVDGMLNLQVDTDFSKEMAGAMLGMEPDEFENEEEVFDVIRELSNIIGGNLKSKFVDLGLPCVLSAPSITKGDDFKITTTNVIQPAQFLFACNDNIIIVEAGVKADVSASIQQDAQPQSTAAPEAGAEHQRAFSAPPAEIDPTKNLDIIMNIPLKVTVELGQTQKRITDVLHLEPGAVVELAQVEGDPVDIMVNHTLIAKGVVVVEKEKYGIRVSEVVSRKERFKSIR